MSDYSCEYILMLPHQFWWCNTHERPATNLAVYKTDGKVTDYIVTCDPSLGGILIPCRCVNLTGIAELE